MIVRQHDATATVLGGVKDDVADREGGTGLVAPVARDVEAPRPIVDMRNPQALALRVFFGKATGEEVARRGETVELQREFGTLIPHHSFVRADER